MLKFFYKSDLHQEPYFINKSINTPMPKASELKFKNQIRPYGRHIPWNYGLDYENINSCYLKKGMDGGIMYVPPSYVINLKHRYDRLAELQLHLNLKIIKPTVYEAIKYKPGYVGCARSHLNLIKEAKKRGDKMLLVFEDDVMPTANNFEARLLQVIMWLSNNMDKWEIFNSIPLGLNYESIDHVLDKEYGMFSTLGGLNTQLIIYNCSIYDKLLSLEGEYYSGDYNGSKKHVLPWDCVLGRLTNMVTCVPILTNVFSNDSDINCSGLALDQPMKNFREILIWEQTNYPHLNNAFHSKSNVTVVITSCFRYAELVKTIDSFLNHNTYPVKEIIITEEAYNAVAPKIKQRYGFLPVKIIKGAGNHMGSLDILYSQITTDWFFHLEEDWECVRGFFIEQSMAIMEADPKIICVWLRDLNDTNLHPVEEQKYINGMNCFKMAYNYSNDWHGYTLNPTLRRKVDIVNHSDFKTETGLAEANISNYYKSLGYYAVILPVAHFAHTGYQSTYYSAFKKLLEQ
jgi:hypothetical protein